MTDFNPKEFKVVALRDCPVPDSMRVCETPDQAAEYWRMHVPSHPYFSPEAECFVVILLNTRRRVKGHHLVSIGTLDTILVSPLAVFRLAVMTSAAALDACGAPYRPLDTAAARKAVSASSRLFCLLHLSRSA